MLDRYNIFKLKGRYFVIDQESQKIVGVGHYGRKAAEQAMAEQVNWDKQRSSASEVVGPLLDQIEELDRPRPVVEIVGQVKGQPSAGSR